MSTETEDKRPSDDGEDRDMAILKKHCIQLSEHFDSVQIFATRHDHDEGRTLKANRGHGNWYANFGCVSEWVDEQRERIRQSVRDEE